MAEKREIRFNLWPQLQNEDLDLMGKGSKEKKSFFKLFKSFELALQLLSKRTALKKWMERLFGSRTMLLWFETGLNRFEQKYSRLSLN